MRSQRDVSQTVTLQLRDTFRVHLFLSLVFSVTFAMPPFARVEA